MLSTSSNKALTKKILFPLSRNPFALAGWRILENRFPQQDYGSSLKKDFPTNKKHVSTCWNDGLTKKYDPFDGKIAFTGSSWLLYKKMEENVFHWAQKQFALVEI